MDFDIILRKLKDGHIDLEALRSLAYSAHKYQSRWETFECDSSLVGAVFTLMTLGDGVQLNLEGHSISVLDNLLINSSNRGIVFKACRQQTRLELFLQIMLYEKDIRSVTDDMCRILWMCLSDGEEEDRVQYFSTFCRAALHVVKEREDVICSEKFWYFADLLLRLLEVHSARGRRSSTCGGDASGGEVEREYESEEQLVATAQAFECLATAANLVERDESASLSRFLVSRAATASKRCIQRLGGRPAVHALRLLTTLVTLDPLVSGQFYNTGVLAAAVRLLSETSVAGLGLRVAATVLHFLAGVCVTQVGQEQVRVLLGVKALREMLKSYLKKPVADHIKYEKDESKRDAESHDDDDDDNNNNNNNAAERGDGKGQSPTGSDLLERAELIVAANRFLVALAPGPQDFVDDFSCLVREPLYDMLHLCHSSNERTSVAPTRALHEIVRVLAEYTTMTCGALRLISDDIVSTVQDILHHDTVVEAGEEETVCSTISLRRRQHLVSTLCVLMDVFQVSRALSHTGDDALNSRLVVMCEALRLTSSDWSQWGDLPAQDVLAAVCNTSLRACAGLLSSDENECKGLAAALLSLLHGRFFDMALAELNMSMDDMEQYLCEDRHHTSGGDSDVSAFRAQVMWLLTHLMRVAPQSTVSLTGDALDMGLVGLGVQRLGCGDLLASRQLVLVSTSLAHGTPALRRRANKRAMEVAASGGEFWNEEEVMTLVTAVHSESRGHATISVLRGALSVITAAAPCLHGLSPTEEEAVAALVVTGLRCVERSVSMLACRAIIAVDAARPEAMHRIFSRPEVEETLLDLLGSDGQLTSVKVEGKDMDDDHRQGQDHSAGRGKREGGGLSDTFMTALAALRAVVRDVNEGARYSSKLSYALTTGSSQFAVPAPRRGSSSPALRHVLCLPTTSLLDDVMRRVKASESASSVKTREQEEQALHQRRLVSMDGPGYRGTSTSALLERHSRSSLNLRLFTQPTKDATFELGLPIECVNWKSAATLALMVSTGTRCAMAAMSDSSRAGKYAGLYSRTPDAIWEVLRQPIRAALEWCGRYAYVHVCRTRRPAVQHGGTGNDTVDGDRSADKHEKKDNKDTDDNGDGDGGDTDGASRGVAKDMRSAMKSLTSAAAEAIIQWESRLPRDQMTSERIVAALVCSLQLYGDSPKMQELMIRALHRLSRRAESVMAMADTGMDVVSSVVRQFSQDREIMGMFLDVAHKAANHSNETYRRSVVECGGLRTLWTVLARRWPVEAAGVLKLGALMLEDERRRLELEQEQVKSYGKIHEPLEDDMREGSKPSDGRKSVVSHLLDEVCVNGDTPSKSILAVTERFPRDGDILGWGARVLSYMPLPPDEETNTIFARVRAAANGQGPLGGSPEARRFASAVLKDIRVGMGLREKCAIS